MAILLAAVLGGFVLAWIGIGLPGWTVWFTQHGVGLLIFAASLLCVLSVRDSAVERFCRRAREHDYAICPECGYLLENLPANHKCPECGTPYDLNQIREVWGNVLGPR